MPFLTIQGHRICYRRYGAMLPERETAVFLHDGLGAMGSWKDLPRALGRAAGLNALAYDRHGYGRSAPRKRFPYGFMEAEVPALAELLDSLALQRVHLIGHSDGASIALLFAARHPERVQSLVAVAPHTFVEARTRQGIQALLDAQAAGNTPGWLKRLHHERADDLLRAWGKGWLSARHKRWSIEEWLGYIKIPAMVVQGEQDEFGSEAQVTAIMNRMEGCEKWLVEGCGHTPHNEAPDAFLRRVGGFLARHAGAAPEPEREPNQEPA